MFVLRFIISRFIDFGDYFVWSGKSWDKMTERQKRIADAWDNFNTRIPERYLDQY